jgi:serine/threonine protein kinase
LIEEDEKGQLSAKLDFVFEPSNAAALFGKQHAYVGPVAWLAPETIETKEHTKFSDAFSFGVFLWELAAKEAPFADRNTIEVACPVVHKGLRLTVPDSAPEAFKTLIAKCFNAKPDARPDFTEIHKTLKAYHDKL